MLWKVGTNLNTTTATPESCRITCAPYAYMGKVLAGNSVLPFPRQTCKSYFYMWLCSRVYVVENCTVGPAGITLGTAVCYRTFRWGRTTGHAAAVGTGEGQRASNAYPFYIHCFRYDPDECFEATKGSRVDFTPYATSFGTCYRSPADENLGSIFSTFLSGYPQLFSVARPCTLLFYYEVFGGKIYNNPRASCPQGLPEWVRTTGESQRDYWLTVFAL